MSQGDQDVQAIGAGPLIFVLIGNTAIFPICRTEGSSLNAEWYAYSSVISQIGGEGDIRAL